MDRIIHDSLFNIDKIYYYSDWLDRLAVNRYQLLTVVWNLFLIFVPFALFWGLKKYWRRTGLKSFPQKITAVFLFLLWLLFFPNAAYVMSDVRHLMDYCPADSANRVCAANAWMIMFFFAYSAFGWLSFYYLLKLMAGLIGEMSRRLYANLFVVLIMPLTALGVLLGLLNRFNSLDALFYPKELISAAGAYFLNPVFFKDWLIFTVFLALLYWLGEAVFKKIKD